MRKTYDRSVYQTWSNMIWRCEHQEHKRYKDYGGRGIKICQRWRESFSAFAEDMGPRPFGYTIDRIDNDGDYEPSNCRWASKTEQARNTRRARFVEIEGVRYHVAELEDKYGANMRSIVYRASLGWPLEKVVSKEKFWNNSESQKKAVAVAAEMKRAQNHCKNGHEFSPDNTYDYHGVRMCRKCRRAWDKFLYYKRIRPISDFL